MKMTSMIDNTGLAARSISAWAKADTVTYLATWAEIWKS